MKLSGSIVLYKTPREELDRAVEMFPGHLYVIDNSPRSITPPAGVTYIHTGKNLGYGRAHNIAIRDTPAEYHAVMNTDVWYTDAIALLVDALESDPTMGAAVPQVIYPTGERQHLCRLLPTPADLILRRFLPSLASNERYELRSWSYAERENIPFVSGCFMVLRASLVKAIGGFDERFFMYCEDIDLSRRLHAISQTAYIPQARITHAYRSQRTKKLRGTLLHIASAIRYFNKWGWLRDADRDRFNRALCDRICDRERLKSFSAAAGENSARRCAMR